MQLAQLLVALLAAHAADDREVHDDGVVRPADVEVALVELDRLLAAPREVVFVAEALQHAAGEQTDVRIVVHEEDAAGALGVVERGGAAGLDFLGLVGPGQKDRESRADPQLGLDAQLAAMASDDGEHGGEAQAGAGLLGGEERVEDLVEVLGLDAAAVVPHLHGDVRARGESGDLARGELDVGGGNPDMTLPGGHGLDGVDDKVLEHLQDLGAIDADRAGVGRDRHFDLHGGTGGGQADRVGENVAGLHDLADSAAATRKSKELLAQGLGREAGALAVFQSRIITVFLGHGNTAQNGGEEVVEIVGDAAGELAEGREAVRANQLLGREAHLARVPEDDDGADEPAGGIRHGAGTEGEGLGRGRADIERELAVERHGLAAAEHAGDRVLARLAVLQVDEAEDLAGILAEAFGEFAAQQILGLGVDINDPAGCIGEHRPLLQGAEQDREMGGGKPETRLGRRAGGLRQGYRKPDDALQFLLPRNLAHDSGLDRHIPVLAMAQAQDVEVGHLAGMLGEEVSLHAPHGLVHGQAAQHGLERVGQFAVGVAEERLEAGREPVEPGGEIEVEHRNPTAVAELLDTLVGAQGGFLEVLAVADVEMRAEHALEGAVGGIVLDADALEPHVMTLGVLHSEFVGEGPRAGATTAARAVRGGGGIIGMDQLQPGIVGVGQGVVGVAQLTFPGR